MNFYYKPLWITIKTVLKLHSFIVCKINIWFDELNFYNNKLNGNCKSKYMIIWIRIQKVVKKVSNNIVKLYIRRNYVSNEIEFVL